MSRICPSTLLISGKKQTEDRVSQLLTTLLLVLLSDTCGTTLMYRVLYVGVDPCASASDRLVFCVVVEPSFIGSELVRSTTRCGW